MASWKDWFTSLIQGLLGSVADAGGGRLTEKIAPKDPRPSDRGKS